MCNDKYKCDCCKIRTEDGWLWLEEEFYKNLCEAVETEEYFCLEDYINSLEINCDDVVCMVERENATILNYHVTQAICGESSFVILDKYDHFYVVHEDGSGIEVEVD